MKILEFSTSIKCNACVEKVSPYLDKVVGVKNWEVATKSEKKILTLRGKMSAKDVEKMVKKAGFKLQLLGERELKQS